MKKSIFLITFLVVGFAAKGQSKEEQAILDLSKKKFQWMISMNYDSLEPVLDERLIFIHSNGWPETKKEFIQDIKSGKLRYKAIDVGEASARVYPETAIVIGRGKFKVALDGKDLEFDLKYTEVYTKKSGKWLLTSRHSNRMQ